MFNNEFLVFVFFSLFNCIVFGILYICLKFMTFDVENNLEARNNARGINRVKKNDEDGKSEEKQRFVQVGSSESPCFWEEFDDQKLSYQPIRQLDEESNLSRSQIFFSNTSTA